MFDLDPTDPAGEGAGGGPGVPFRARLICRVVFPLLLLELLESTFASSAELKFS